MTGTALLVLVTLLIIRLLVVHLALVVHFSLARRNGQRLKSLSISLVHGYTAEFSTEEPQSGNN